MEKELLKVENLSVNFGTNQVLTDISFSLRQGETLALVGESGSGKSVLAKMILQLVHSPNLKIKSGSIFYREKDLLKENEIEKIRGKEISMVFQDPMSALNPTMDILAQVTEALFIHEKVLSKKECRKKAQELIVQIVDSLKDRELDKVYPSMLSGGQAQRILIAIAIIANPRLLIADEPTTALDKLVQKEILDLLKTLQKEKSLTVLFITHDLSIVRTFCQRTLVMYAGKIVESARTEELFKNPKHPYTQALLKASPSLNTQESTLFTIPGIPPKPGHTPKGCAFHPRCSYTMDCCKKAAPPLFPLRGGRSSACFLHDKKEEEKV